MQNYSYISPDNLGDILPKGLNKAVNVDFKFFSQYSVDLNMDPIGFGNQGTVRECRCLRTNRLCAVKILKYSAAADREIESLSKCKDNHNIVQMIDVIRDKVSIFIYF